jgi:formate C-acetyltransferase
MLKFGLGQSEGRDREGLSALLNSIAKADPTGIGCGSSVTNITLDEKLMKNDEAFEKTVDMLLTYFKMGGVHFQLNYISREDLICAKKTPDEYKNLRVRVSGFSDYFVKLNEAIQDEVISRTEKR